jgi:hypothetical protein
MTSAKRRRRCCEADRIQEAKRVAVAPPQQMLIQDVSAVENKVCVLVVVVVVVGEGRAELGARGGDLAHASRACPFSPGQLPHGKAHSAGRHTTEEGRAENCNVGKASDIAAAGIAHLSLPRTVSLLQRRPQHHFAGKLLLHAFNALASTNRRMSPHAFSSGLRFTSTTATMSYRRHDASHGPACIAPPQRDLTRKREAIRDALSRH